MTPRKLTAKAKSHLHVDLEPELYKWLVNEATSQQVTLTALVTAILEEARGGQSG